MTEETMSIFVTHGPYRDQRLVVSKAHGQSAVSEGWAVDPSQPVDHEKEPKQLTDEERAKIVEKAHQAAIRLRGEDKAEEKDKSMKPHEEAGYQTRDVRPTPAPTKK